jgi:hypothetical protein
MRAQLDQLNQQVQQGRQSQVQSVISQVESNAKGSAMADIDRVLTTAKLDKVFSPVILNSQRNEIYETLKTALPAHDPSGWQNYQIQLQQASRGQLDPATATNTFRQLFRNALRNSPDVRQRVNELVQGAKSNVDAQHIQRQQTQMRTEPNGVGIPAPSSVVSSQQLARQPGESLVDFNTRKILAASQRQTGAPAR